MQKHAKTFLEVMLRFEVKLEKSGLKKSFEVE